MIWYEIECTLIPSRGKFELINIDLLTIKIMSKELILGNGKITFLQILLEQIKHIQIVKQF